MINSSTRCSLRGFVVQVVDIGLVTWRFSVLQVIVYLILPADDSDMGEKS